MPVHGIGRAAVVALAVSGMACAGPGAAAADHGHGATAHGGSAAVGTVFQQNTAQEHRQNNTCAQWNGMVSSTLTGARSKAICAAHDASVNKHTLVKGGGAHAEGGSATIGNVSQQNTAQQGRQNNACANPDATEIDLTGGRASARCINKDHSFSHLTVTKSRGAHAEGGSSTGTSVIQQNTAQEGRQNNSCGNPRGGIITLTGGQAAVRCINKDHSFSHLTLTKGGGARAEGGSSTGAGVFQQNTAQEGRQNNSCADLNSTSLALTGSKAEVECAAIDHSARVGTAEFSRGAEAEGGSGAGNLFQQNTAQDGRQNNNCGNPNSVTLTASGSRIRTRCKAVDESEYIRGVDR